MCKFLSSISVRIDGGYQESDGGYREATYEPKLKNGLEVFAWHDIINDEELEKIAEDKELVEIILREKYNPNTQLVDYLMENLFNDFQLSQYLDIINSMKDWEEIFPDPDSCLCW